jgi:hypothetical protein
MTSLVDSNGVDCFDHISPHEDNDFYNKHLDFPNVELGHLSPGP